MAYPGFTGNPNIDTRILFSLPDRELRRLCSTSRYFRDFCTSPANEVYWQERYRENFPYLPPVMQDSWYATYWYTVEHLQLSTNRLRQLLSSTHVRGPCLIPYLQHLSRQLLRLLATTPLAVIQQKIDEDEGELAEVIKEELPYPLSPPYENVVVALLGILLQEEGRVATPWGLNYTIEQDDFFHWALPEVTSTLPITINVQGQVGVHELDQMQFLGMMVYTIYAAPGEVVFYLGKCPLCYTPNDIQDIIDWELRHTGAEGTIVMRNGDELPLPAIEEFMQGFITVARWLGRNYRLGYSRITQ
jgi:hypothetical protein